MPRRQLQFATGCYYHLYNRGAGRQQIFLDEHDYTFVLRKLEEYAKQLHITVVAYCLMPNHYHLLVRQDGEQNAGLLVQRTFNSYTKRFNRRHGRTGTLFETRYKSKLIDTDTYLLHLCRYIHSNPVKGRVAISSGFVAVLELCRVDG